MFLSDCIILRRLNSLVHRPHVHILRCLCLIWSSLQYITLPGGPVCMDIADTRMMECNDLCGVLHNSTETGNMWEKLASREAIAQLVFNSWLKYNNRIWHTTCHPMCPFKAMRLLMCLSQVTQQGTGTALWKSVGVSSGEAWEMTLIKQATYDYTDKDSGLYFSATVITIWAWTNSCTICLSIKILLMW